MLHKQSIQIQQCEKNKRKQDVRSFSALPCGSPPPFGERFVQKMVWLMCPPPLNFRAGWRATCVVTSPTIQIDSKTLSTTKMCDCSYMRHYNAGTEPSSAIDVQNT